MPATVVSGLVHALNLEPAVALVPPWQSSTLNGSMRDEWPQQRLSRQPRSHIEDQVLKPRSLGSTSRADNDHARGSGNTSYDRLHPHGWSPLQRAFKRQAENSIQAGVDTTTMEWAFDHQGLLFHVIRQTDVESWIQGNEPWFSIDRDCGNSCSAWSLERKDLPFIVFLKFDFNRVGGWGNEGIGYISDVVKLAQKVVAMAPVDSNSVNRQCCTPGDFWSRPAGFRDSHGRANPLYCSGNCPRGDRDCQAFRAGGAANVWDLMTWGEKGCHNASSIQAGKCDQCRLGHRGAPYWCDNPGTGVQTAKDWMRLYGDDTSLRNFNQIVVRQCKFRQEQWETWIAATKLLHETCLQKPGCPNYECCQAAKSRYGTVETYLENEVNLYFHPDDEKRDQELWDEAINGVFYLDMGNNKGAYKKDKAKMLAAAMVEQYNKVHSRKIKLYRANTELPGNVTRWKPGEWLNLSDFVEEVPEKELHGILRNASLHLNISRSVSSSA